MLALLTNLNALISVYNVHIPGSLLAFTSSARFFDMCEKSPTLTKKKLNYIRERMYDISIKTVS